MGLEILFTTDNRQMASDTEPTHILGVDMHTSYRQQNMGCPYSIRLISVNISEAAAR